jgi:hypothetical protein
MYLTPNTYVGIFQDGMKGPWSDALRNQGVVISYGQKETIVRYFAKVERGKFKSI